jgi:hypothetical protein
MSSSSTSSTGPHLDGEHIFDSFFAPNIFHTNENKSKEYDERLEELKDEEANASAAAKTSIKSKEKCTHCVSATPLFLDLFPCSRNKTYLCIDTKLSIIVGHWNKLRMTRYQEGENNEIMHMLAPTGAYIRMLSWHPPFTIMGR